MDSRKRIGILYQKSINWMGGVYYIQNLISALTLQKDSICPIIDVYCNNIDDFNELKTITNYSYLVYNKLKVSKVKMILNRLFYYFHLYKLFALDTFDYNKEDKFVFPVIGAMNLKSKQLGWIADFQYCYYPQNFSKKELHSKHIRSRMFSIRKTPVVFSSETCKKDFETFYPDFPVKSFLLRFAVTLPDFSSVNIEKVKGKYGIGSKYFFCPNQFWKHKNHLFLFKTFVSYLESGGEGQLICTGYPKDYRNPDYTNEVISYLNDSKYSNSIKALGFLERTEMLCLMKYSYAVIQPSLFEGWSTVVEDAKALNKFVFLSDLDVHREQMHNNVCFFNPTDSNDLTKKLLNVEPQVTINDYNRNREQFSESLIDIINQYN